MTLVLVDGYNLIRRIPELRAVERRSGLEAGRRELDNRLSGYTQGRTGVRVTVVYDGALNPEAPSAYGGGGFTALFREDADRGLVELALHAAARGEQVRAVSSDRAGVVSQLAGNNRIETLSAEVFWRELGPKSSRRGAKTSSRGDSGTREKPGHVSKAEVNYWLEAFGASGEEEE